MMFPDHALAHFLLDFRSGLTIGESAHNGFNLLGKWQNVDVTDDQDTVFKRSEREMCGRSAAVDIVAPADRLPVPDESQDGVVSSHVWEHVWDTLGAALEWDRVVRPGGIILAIVPKRDALPSDAGRPVTTIQELEDRHSGKTPPPPESDAHHTVFDMQLLQDIVEWSARNGARWVVAFEETDRKAGNGHTLIVRKVRTAQRTGMVTA